MRYFISFIFCLVLIAVSSCRKDFDTVPSFGQLEFSKDTVFLDTVFTKIGSATYNLKVYNRGNKSITVPKIQLKNGLSSNYRLNIDGVSGKEFFDIDILSKDSIYVFVETTIDISNIPNPLYTDRILFDNGTNQQGVDLVTLVQDANFIYPGRNPVTLEVDSLILDGNPTNVEGRFLKDSELTFTNQKPTVIYGFVAVPKNKTLTIEAGAKIYFHNNSGLVIDNQATLKVNGTKDKKVVFEGDRLEYRFSNVPGQWGYILIRAGSINNTIQHAIIKNGTAGIVTGNFLGSDLDTSLKIENTEIYNHSVYGIWARKSDIDAYNVVIGNASLPSLAITVGGTYNFTHCTFANYWSNSLRKFSSVLVNNYQDYKDENDQTIRVSRALQAANFTNCIIGGNNNIEFILDKDDRGLFNYSVRNCLIQFNDIENSFAEIPELDFTNANYQNIILNGNPHFKDSANEDFIIGQDSDANNNAIPTSFSFDILGVDRSATPDIGAYQHIIFDP